MATWMSAARALDSGCSLVRRAAPVSAGRSRRSAVAAPAFPASAGVASVYQQRCTSHVSAQPVRPLPWKKGENSKSSSKRSNDRKKRGDCSWLLF